MPPSITATVATRLQQFRHARNLTVPEVAAVLGQKPVTVYAVERGDLFPSQPSLLGYCRLYRIEPVDVFIDPERNLRHQLYERIRLTPEEDLGKIADALAALDEREGARTEPARSAAKTKPAQSSSTRRRAAPVK